MEKQPTKLFQPIDETGMTKKELRALERKRKKRRQYQKTYRDKNAERLSAVAKAYQNDNRTKLNRMQVERRARMTAEELKAEREWRRKYQQKYRKSKAGHTNSRNASRRYEAKDEDNDI